MISEVKHETIKGTGLKILTAPLKKYFKDYQ